jgi:hydrogenase maturation protease
MRVSGTEVVSLRDPLKAGDEAGARGTPDWRVFLKETISDRRSPIHLVGAGNELRKDDAVGLEVISALRSKLGSIPAPGVTIHANTPMVERLLSELASAEGRIVIFDAVEASSEPGTVVFRPMADTKYGFFGTHNIPLRLVPGLQERLDDVFLVGVQPGSLEVGNGLSKPVRDSLREIVAIVTQGVEERA